MLVAKKVFKEIKKVDNITLLMPARYQKFTPLKNLLNVHWIKKDSKLFPLIALINERINF